jgi:hypothetical protein
MIPSMRKAVARHAGVVLQLVGVFFALTGLYYLVGREWTMLAVGVLLIGLGTLHESGLLSAPRGRKTGGA